MGANILTSDARFSVQVMHFDSLPSTNTEAARQATLGAAEGLCIVAGEQTAGRGRLQREWASPKGAGLYFSIVLRPSIEQRLWPLITMSAALAVFDALYKTYELKTDIKWPNDILINDKKLCGILAETVETSWGRAVVVGIGINLTSKFLPADVLGIATSIHDAIQKIPESQLVVDALIPALQKHYQILQSTDGAESVVREWCARSSYATGKKVSVSSGDDVFTGITRGLESDGALRIETGTGEIRTIRTGDLMTLRTSPS